jgi:hypothetical protein
MMQTSSQQPTPLLKLENLPNDYPSANLEFRLILKLKWIIFHVVILFVLISFSSVVPMVQFYAVESVHLQLRVEMMVHSRCFYSLILRKD